MIKQWPEPEFWAEVLDQMRQGRRASHLTAGLGDDAPSVQDIAIARDPELRRIQAELEAIRSAAARRWAEANPDTGLGWLAAPDECRSPEEIAQTRGLWDAFYARLEVFVAEQVAGA